MVFRRKPDSYRVRLTFSPKRQTTPFLLLDSATDIGAEYAHLVEPGLGAIGLHPVLRVREANHHSDQKTEDQKNSFQFNLHNQPLKCPSPILGSPDTNRPFD